LVLLILLTVLLLELEGGLVVVEMALLAFEEKIWDSL